MEVHDGAGGICTVQKLKRCPDNVRLALDIVRRSDGSAHEVRSDQHPRHLEFERLMPERTDEDRNRRDPGGLKDPGDVPYGHVTYRSGGNQQHRLNVLGTQRLGPTRRCVVAKP